jgi:hypothetical protein
MKAQDFIFLPFLTLVVLGGLALIRLGADDIWRAFTSTRWHIAPGLVLKSGVTRNMFKSGTTTRGSGNYYASITVGYRVNGRDYTTNRIYFGPSVNSTRPSDVALWVLRYPVGKKVSISHHPQHPSIATIRPGITGDVLSLPVAGLAVILLGAISIVIYLASRAELSVSGLMIRLISLFFLLPGIGLVAGVGLCVWHAHASRSWPVTRGVMISGSTEFRATDITDSDDAKPSRYSVYFGYRYELNGEEYFSDLCRFGQQLDPDTQAAHDLAQRYPAGTEVNVTYCPTDPELAVLELGISSVARWGLGAGIIIVVFALSFFIASFWL